MIGDDWTRIKPEDMEALGWTDMYCEDEDGQGNGMIGIYEYADLPTYLESLTAYFLATHWEINATSCENGTDVFNVVTPEDYNEVMEYIGVDCLMNTI